jgi:CRISPR-associated protein Csm2
MAHELNVKWVTGDDPINTQTINWAHDLGQYLASGGKTDAMTTSQIRKFFGEVKRIQADFQKHKDDAPMLSAKLAYAVGRQKGKERIKKFYIEFDKAIKAIDGNEENYNRFVKLLESTVAFHKFHGGND